MSPHYGMATTHQLTDQSRWEAMLEALVREMPGCWKRLEEDVKDELEVNLLEATEAFNFGSDHASNMYWACVEHTEEEVKRSLQDKRDRKQANRRYDFETDKLEKELNMWDSFPAGLTMQVTDRIQNSKYFSVRPPNALECLEGEHPRLPRYARHFCSLVSKNVDFSSIVFIMGQFFGDAIYNTGHECEGELEEGVTLTHDGSGPGFYASLREKFRPESVVVQEVGDNSASAGSSSTALVAGSRIQVQGLKARPDLNGREGLALQYVDTKGRWEVMLDGDILKPSLAVKAGNLKVLAQDELSSDEKVVTWTSLPEPSNKFSVAAVLGKGIGVVAIASIGKGELILKEQPMFFLSGRDTMTAMMAGGKENLVKSQVQRLEKGQQDAFWALHDCRASTEEKTALGIWDTNAIGHGEASLSSSEGIYLLGSRFNHSCLPNVIRVWKEGEGVEVFHAARDIAPGEELTIWYSHVFSSRSKRQAELRRAFHFTCSCEVCCLKGTSQKKSDTLREEYGAVNERLPSMGGECKHALKLVDREIELIESEFAGNAWLLKSAYYDGFQFALGTRNVALAKSMISKALEYKVFAEGNGRDEEMVLWSAYAADPCSHPIGRQLGLAGSSTVQANKMSITVPKTKPNATCPCGSGKKYKKCCGSN